MKICDTPFFKTTKQPHSFINPPPLFLWEKSEPHLFFQKFQNLLHNLFQNLLSKTYIYVLLLGINRCSLVQLMK